MDYNDQKTKLSFSIENILRDDFSTRPRKDVATVAPAIHSSFAKWPNIPVYRICAVRYNPVFVQLLPRWQTVGTKFNRVQEEKQLLFPEQPRDIEEEHDCLACEDREGEGNKFLFVSSNLSQKKKKKIQ